MSKDYFVVKGTYTYYTSDIFWFEAVIDDVDARYYLDAYGNFKYKPGDRMLFQVDSPQGRYYNNYYRFDEVQTFSGSANTSVTILSYYDFLTESYLQVVENSYSPVASATWRFGWEGAKVKRSSGADGQIVRISPYLETNFDGDYSYVQARYEFVNGDYYLITGYISDEFGGGDSLYSPIGPKVVEVGTSSLDSFGSTAGIGLGRYVIDTTKSFYKSGNRNDGVSITAYYEKDGGIFHYPVASDPGLRGLGSESAVFLDSDAREIRVSHVSGLLNNNGNGIPAAISSSTAGAFREGVTLQAPVVTGDPDGDAINPDYAYQWYKDGVALAQASTSSYVVPSSGAGTYRVAITYSDAQSFRVTVDSPEQVVAAYNNGSGTPAPISSSAAGAFRERVTLRAPAVSGDPDGDAVNPDYTYQWYKDGVAITAATASSYAVPLLTAGAYNVAITYSDAEGHRLTLQSAEQVVTGLNTISLTLVDAADRLTGHAVDAQLLTVDRLTWIENKSLLRDTRLFDLGRNAFAAAYAIKGSPAFFVDIASKQVGAVNPVYRYSLTPSSAFPDAAVVSEVAFDGRGAAYVVLSSSHIATATGIRELVRLDSGGSVVYRTVLSSDSGDGARTYQDLAIDQAGQLILSGYSENPTNAFIERRDSATGALLWRSLPFDRINEGWSVRTSERSLMLLADGTALLAAAGYFYPSQAGNGQMIQNYLARINLADGSTLERQRVDGTHYTQAGSPYWSHEFQPSNNRLFFRTVQGLYRLDGVSRSYDGGRVLVEAGSYAVPATDSGTRLSLSDPFITPAVVSASGAPDLFEVQVPVTATLNARSAGPWTVGYVACNAGSLTKPGTRECISLRGLGRYSFVATAIDEAITTIRLEPDQDTAFFLHDAYSAFYSDLALQPDRTGRPSARRLLQIDTVLMGSAGGTSIVDLTSQDYVTGAVTVHGAQRGRSVFWGSDGDETFISGGGDTLIYGGAGDNAVTLGAGVDRLQYRSGGGARDVVRGFDPSQDRLQLWAPRWEQNAPPLVHQANGSTVFSWAENSIEFVGLSVDSIPFSARIVQGI